MPELLEVQHRFLDYLRHADDTITENIAGAEAERLRRLSIYFNAYRVRFKGVIDSDHPVLGAYLGDTLFDRMVREYVDSTPSSRTSLRYYCDRLPAFLRQMTPYSDWPVVADIAEFERLLMDVFDAADAARRDSNYLRSLDPPAWPELTLHFHPSVRIFVTPWNTIEIWRAIKASRNPPAAKHSEPQAWLIWRNREMLSEFRSMPVDEHHVISQAIAGAPLAGLCEMLLDWHVENDVPRRASDLLTRWLCEGLLIGDSQGALQRAEFPSRQPAGWRNVVPRGPNGIDHATRDRVLRSNSKHVPALGWLTTVMRLLCKSRIRLTMARPSPEAWR